MIDRAQHEIAAIEAHRDRVQAFGRQLLKLFQEVMAEQREPIGSQILPLFTFYQAEAKVRLSVIEQLTARLNSTTRMPNAILRVASTKAVAKARSDLSRMLAAARAWAIKKVF